MVLPELPNIVGACTKSREGASSRKGLVVNVQMEKIKDTPAPPSPAPIFRSSWRVKRNKRSSPTAEDKPVAVDTRRNLRDPTAGGASTICREKECSV